MVRVLLTRTGCMGCNEFMKVLPSINLRLPIEGRIRVINCFEFEEWAIKNHPILDRITFRDYPVLYLDGILIEGVAWAEQIKIFLESYFKEEFVV